MCQTGKIGSFDYEQQENGTFLYKANNSQPLLSLKLKDKAQFKVIDTMEDEFKKTGKKMIENIGIDTMKFLKKQ